MATETHARDGDARRAAEYLGSEPHKVAVPTDADRREWHELYRNTHAARFETVREYVNRYAAGNKLLEVGAAPCHLQVLLERDGYDVLGVDLNPERVKNFAEYHDLDVIQKDIEARPMLLPQAGFDVATLSEVLEHLERPLVALENIRQALHPDGVLVLTTPNLSRLETWVRFIVDKGFDEPTKQFPKADERGHRGHLRLYSGRQVRQMLEATGWKVATVDRMTYDGSTRPGPASTALNSLYRLVPRVRPHIVAVASPGRHDRD